MLPSAEKRPDFNEAVLAACGRTLVWQSHAFKLYRLVEGAGAWDALVVPAPRDGRRSISSSKQAAESAYGRDAPIAVLEEAGHLVIIFDSFSIAGNLTASNTMALDAFLPLALALARSVAAAHADGAMLGYLHPLDFAVDRDGEVRLRDWPAIVSLTGQPTSGGRRGILDDIVYRAPEELRPVNPQPDARSDLYALGMILFRLLTGRFPLAAVTAVEWRHAHLAVPAREAGTLWPGLPPVIDRILSRLLAKEPVERYQSAFALELDLARCADEWRKGHAISDFEIGRIDAPFARLWTPALFGRAEEDSVLQATLDRFLAGRRPVVISVVGQAGVGKSALVQTLAARLGRHGLFLQGKSDQQQSERPYAPIVQALRAVIDEAMRADHRQVASLRKALARDLRGSVRLLLDLVPALEVITGREAAAKEVPGPFVQLRLQRAVRAVLAAAATHLAPVVLFLDDVQWADDATRSLLALLIGEPVDGVLLILARRDQPRNADVEGWLSKAPDTLAEAVAVDLGPLTRASTRQMLQTIFPDATASLIAMADTLHDKTGGNPFYLRRLLQALVQDGVIHFSRIEGAWSCRSQDVARYPASDNIVSFVTARLAKEGPEALALMQTMACIGPQADQAVLAKAMAVSEERLLQLAAPLVRSGFLLSSQSTLGFAHDRIQEAAYSLLDPDARRDRHLLLADVMLSLWDIQASAAAFAVAGQIERCEATRLSPDRRMGFVQVLLVALAHAKRSAAFGQAARYGEEAVTLIGEDAWATDRALAFRANIQLCECLLGAAELDAADSRLTALLARAETDIDRSDVFRLRANLLTLKSDYEGAIDASLLGLSELDVSLARGSTSAEQDQAYHRLRAMLGERSILSLSDLPAAEDPRIRAAMSLLAPLISSVFTTDGLRFLHLAKMVELTLLHGVCPESAHGLAWFGSIIAERYDAYRDGLDFALAAEAMVERHGLEEHRTSVLLAVDQVAPWTRPMDEALAKVREAMDAAHSAGDVGWMCYARNHLISDLLVMGEALPTIRAEATEALKVTQRFGYTDIEHILAAQLRFVRELSGEADGGGPNELETSAATPVVAPTTAFWVSFNEGAALYLRGAVSEAVVTLARADALGTFLLAHVDTAICKFFLGLAIASSGADLTSNSPDRLRFDEIRARFALWAGLNPGTFAVMRLMLDAGAARIDGDHVRALTLYEQAANSARASRFEHHYAIALEHAGRCCLEIGNRIGAQAYLSLAADAYRRWGATRKATQVLAAVSAGVSGFDEPPALPVAAEAGDLETVLATSLALSEEIVLDRVIDTLMTRMLIHAGANRGLLFRIIEGRPELEASAWLDDGNVRVSIASPDRFGLTLSYGVIDRALRARAPFVVSGPDLGAGTSDTNGTIGRSVLCVPLLRRGELTGLLCLQNDYLEGVFASDAVALVTLLASQAAISLENARLYTELLEENERRATSEQALSVARAELEKNSRLTLLGSIAASVTHEIGQPLAAIASNAGAGLRWLQRPQPDIGETLSVLTEIEASVARAHDIIRALRALSKQAPRVQQPVDVDEMIRDVLRIARSEFDRHETDVVLVLSSTGMPVLGDATQLQQVVLNLIRNGMEAMENVPAAKRQIVVTSTAEAAGVTVSIRDFGSGIPADIAAQIFEPMYTTKASGMGMGLAICKSIIEAHGGLLTATGEDIGTRFTFSLPVQTAGQSPS
jgi:predicted ATPase/signal transduction histidine kinase